MSLPGTKILHGVTIKKLPVARYIAALDIIENLPAVLAGELIPEAGGSKQFIDKLMKADPEFIQQVIIRALKVIPTECCSIISELLDIPIERLIDKNCKDPLSLNDLLEVITAAWEMNDMTDFFLNVRKLKTKLTAQKIQNTGSNVG